MPYVPGWEHIAQKSRHGSGRRACAWSHRGLGAARAVASHYSVMVRGLSQVFTAGPKVAAAFGEEPDTKRSAAADIHARNGVIDEEAASEDEAFALARRFLSYLPSSIRARPE
ncbi:MAG: carboxyl transferase domain-containing protein [Parvularculaceae bacterium]